MSGFRAELTGLFGDPVDDNPTGVIEEAGFAAAGLNYRYITIKIEKGHIAEAVQAARTIGMKGFNLTMPHKIDVIPFLDELSPAARITGAVNTVIMKDGRLIGENTDGKGFVIALKDSGDSLKDKNICILGAGGAARAVATECALEGARKITVVNRTASRGQDLAKLINDSTDAQAEYVPWNDTFIVPLDTDILINGTCIGFSPNVDELPDIDYNTIKTGMTACDVVFSPSDTKFLKACRKKGAKTIDGTGMLVRQAALNFKLWTNHEASLDVMSQAFNKVNV